MRFLCRMCRRTFVSTLGTPYYRMRRPRRDFDQTMKLVVEGVPKAGIARVTWQAQSVSPSTIARWAERGARHLQRFDDEHLHLAAAVEFQLDELKSHGAGDRDRIWVFSAVEVWSRVWAALRVGPRTLRSTLIFLRKLRATCGAFLAPVLVTSDEFKYYLQVLRRIFGPGWVYVQVENRAIPFKLSVSQGNRK